MSFVGEVRLLSSPARAPLNLSLSLFLSLCFSQKVFSS